MTIYVTKSIWKVGRLTRSHLLADSLAELHSFAKKISLHQDSFKPETQSYELTAPERNVVIANGAKEVNTREGNRLMNRVGKVSDKQSRTNQE